MEFVSREGGEIVNRDRISQQLVNQINERLSIGRKNDHAHCVIACLFSQSPLKFLWNPMLPFLILVINLSRTWHSCLSDMSIQGDYTMS
jgi:hypothetical protein